MSIENVLANGFCVGCGVCAVAQPTGFRMRFTEFGTLEAELVEDKQLAGSSLDESASKVCPFADQPHDEDDLAERAFPDASSIDPDIGRHIAAYIGHVEEGDFRMRASSGGFVSWILAELLRTGQVDGVIHVKATAASDGRLFRYGISRDEEELKSGAKSRYYPVEMSEVLTLVKRTPGRYVVTGVPCFIKALRLSCLGDAILRERLRFFVGLVCGHLKSARFGEFFAWQLGIPPGSLRGVDFRVKLEGRAASRYGIEVRGLRGGEEVTRVAPMSDLYGSDWGVGFFKYKACEFCDDVVAETADVAVGDAWLPAYESDWRGTNVVVVRSSQINALVTKGIEQGQLALNPVSAQEVAESQRSGLRHRREGLASRLAWMDGAGQWRPKKRTAAAQPGQIGLERQRIYQLRLRLVTQGAVAYEAARRDGRLATFRRGVRSTEMAYLDAVDRSSQPRWALRFIKRRIKASITDWQLHRAVRTRG